MLNSAGNRLVHFIFTNSHVQPSYNESRGEVMLEGLVLLPPRQNDTTTLQIENTTREYG